MISPRIVMYTVALSVAAATAVASIAIAFFISRAPAEPTLDLVREPEPILDFEDRWEPVNSLPPMITRVKTLSFLEPQEVSDIVVTKMPIVTDTTGVIKMQRRKVKLEPTDRSKAVCSAHGLRTVWNGRWSWRCQK